MDKDLSLFDPDEELDELVTPTPLSDPVFTAIFQDANVSGLAMRSFLNATLENSGDDPVSKVLTVTPQRVHSETSERAFRIDVEAWTAGNETVLVEVQLTPFSATIERDLLYSEQALASVAKRGDKLMHVISKMPRVIVVNILENALRKVGGYHQVVELLYREPPYERATDKLAIHNLELDKYRKAIKDNPSTPLECWLTAICRSQDGKLPLSEVVKMDEQLQAYCNADPGFAQFVDRHAIVAATPEVRKAYRRWQYDLMLNQLDKERQEEKINAQLQESEARGRAEGRAEGRTEGRAEGRTEGRTEGRADTQMEIALKAFANLKKGQRVSDITDTLKSYGIPNDVIKAAQKQSKS